MGDGGCGRNERDIQKYARFIFYLFLTMVWWREGGEESVKGHTDGDSWWALVSHLVFTQRKGRKRVFIPSFSYRWIKKNTKSGLAVGSCVFARGCQYTGILLYNSGSRKLKKN